MTSPIGPTSFETSAILQTEQLGHHTNFGDCENTKDKRPWRKLDHFSVFCPKSGELRPLQNVNEGIQLRFRGIVEPYDQAESSERKRCAVKDIGPILERSFQGYGESKLIVWISTARAHYALKDPAPEYRPFFEPLQILSDLCASVYILLSEHPHLPCEEVSNRLPRHLKNRFEEFKKQVAVELLAFEFIELLTGAQIEIEELEAIQEMSKGRKRKLSGVVVGSPSGKARSRAKRDSSTDSEVVKAAPSDDRQKVLLEMGFEERLARQAVRATRGESIDAALGWILAKNLETEEERPASRSSQPSGSTRTPPTPPLEPGKLTPLLRNPDDAAEESDESSPPLQVNRRRRLSGGLETQPNLPPCGKRPFEKARMSEEGERGESLSPGGLERHLEGDVGNRAATELSSPFRAIERGSFKERLPSQSVSFARQSEVGLEGSLGMNETVKKRRDGEKTHTSCANERGSDGARKGLEDGWRRFDLNRLATGEPESDGQQFGGTLPEGDPFLQRDSQLTSTVGEAANLLSGGGSNPSATEAKDSADRRSFLGLENGQKRSDFDNARKEQGTARPRSDSEDLNVFRETDRELHSDPFARSEETSETFGLMSRAKKASQQPGSSRLLEEPQREKEQSPFFADTTEGLESFPRNELPEDNLDFSRRSESPADGPLAEAERLQRENHTGATLSLLCREVEILIDAFAIWWELDKRFYTVKAVGYDPATHRHKVKFLLDEEEEWLSLPDEEVKLLEEGKDYNDLNDIPKFLNKDGKPEKATGRKVIRNGASGKQKASAKGTSKAKNVELEAELLEMEADEAATALEDDVRGCHVSASERLPPPDERKSAVRNGPQTFFFLFENVASANKGQAGIDANGGTLEKENVWGFVQRHLWGIPPEVVDSAEYSVAHRRRKYVSNIPTEGRFQFGPKPPLTISSMWPEYFANFPEWDIRKARDKLNMITTRELYPQALSILNGLLSTGEELNTERKKLIREYNLIFTSPKTVATLREDEVERIMGFPPGHMRLGRPRSIVLQMLGNSFQVDTIMELLSPLREYFCSLPGGISVISLFDGIGGLLVAFWRLGIRIKRYISVEKEEGCRNVVSKFWSDNDLNRTGRLEFVNDIRDLSTSKIAQIVEECPVDFIGGGSPCNNLTGNNRCPSNTSGGRSGLLGGDSRLFLEFPRVLNEVERLQLRRGRGNVLLLAENN